MLVFESRRSNVVYRFAQDLLAPRVRVEFTIPYLPAVDGTDNIGYLVSRITEVEAPDACGT